MHSSARLVAAATLFVSTTSLLAQAAWTSVAATGPSARTEVIMPTDQAGALLFGGVNGPTQTAFNELWRFDGVGWIQLSPGGIPPTPRSRLGGDYDLFRGRLVLFGGDAQYAGGGALGDTWEYDTATNQWFNPQPATVPSARVHGRMAFELPQGRMVMFGGRLGAVVNNETWTWDGTDWTQQLPNTSPPPREQASICYDAGRGNIVMFGGSTGAASGVLGDTWIWQGGDWQQVSTATIPGGTGLRNAKMTYDSLRDRVVLFGGVASNGFSSSVWEFDGVDWTLRQPAPGPSTRAGMGVVYVPALSTTVVACGFNGAFWADTWTWQTNAPATVTNFGSGCPTSAGVPTLTVSPLPWAGDTVTWNIGSLPPNGLSLLLFGFSSQSWNGLPLPLSMAFAGFPACDLLISPDSSSVVPGSFTTTLPPPVIGLSVLNQAAVLEPTAVGSGLGMSAGVQILTGAR